MKYASAKLRWLMNYETFVQSHSVAILKLSFATTTTENSGFATNTRAHARDTGKCGFKAKNPNRITA